MIVAKVKSGGMTCTCGPASFGWTILAAIMYTQWNGGDWLTAMVWSAIGFFVMLWGKVAKWKGFCCPAHAMH